MSRCLSVVLQLCKFPITEITPQGICGGVFPSQTRWAGSGSLDICQTNKKKTLRPNENLLFCMTSSMHLQEHFILAVSQWHEVQQVERRLRKAFNTFEMFYHTTRQQTGLRSNFQCTWQLRGPCPIESYCSLFLKALNSAKSFCKHNPDTSSFLWVLQDSWGVSGFFYRQAWQKSHILLQAKILSVC